MQADLERRFGALRRLYGDAGYARLRAARVAVVGVGGVGSWAAEALARSGVASLVLIDLDHVAESNINRQVQALGRTLGQAKVLALRERIADIHPGCEVLAVEEFVDAQNWPALLPAARGRGHRRLRPGARQGGDGGLGAGRRAALRQRGRGRRQAPGAARRRRGPGRRHARPAARVRCASACAASTAPRGRAASACAACSRASRWLRRRRLARPMTPTTAPSTATATAPASPSPPPSAWWPPARPSRNCWRATQNGA